MADNVTIPATGSGTATPVVATDDVSGVHYQYVKLADGTLDASTKIAAASGTGANALRVVPAVAGTATLSNVASSASNVTLISSNAARIGAMLFNDSTSAVYVKFGATATSSSYTVKVAAGGYYELPSPVYTGIVDGIWVSANGNMRVTEMT